MGRNLGDVLFCKFDSNGKFQVLEDSWIVSRLTFVGTTEKFASQTEKYDQGF